MKRLRLPLIALVVLLLAAVVWGGYQGTADSAAVGNSKTIKSHDVSRVKELLQKRITNAQRLEAAQRADQKVSAAATGTAVLPSKGGTPNYFGPESNWAFSPQPAVDPATGLAQAGSGGYPQVR